jgi:hypothetical protein
MAKQDMLPLEASLRPLIGSLNGLQTSTSQRLAKADDARKAAAAYSSERARLLFGQFRKGDANDPETYVASIAAMLAEYPADVVKLATDPRSGLAATQDFLPTVKEIREFCDGVVEHRAEQARRDAELVRQLAERERYEQTRARAPTREELQARGVLPERKPIRTAPAEILWRVLQEQRRIHGDRVQPSAETRTILEAAGYQP